MVAIKSSDPQKDPSGTSPVPSGDSTKISRSDVGSWISGPRQALEAAGIDLGYRGERLGLPEDGIGSIAGFGRQAGAILIDWLACALVAHLIFPGVVYGSPESAINTLGVFFFIKTLFTWLGGATPGQRLAGIRVITMTGGIIQPWCAAIRTFLVCLLVPAVIWNRDGRGLQDLASKTLVVRSR